MLLNIDKNEKRAKFDALPSPEVSSVEVRNISAADGGYAGRIVQWLQSKDVLGKSYKNNDTGWGNIAVNKSSVKNVVHHKAGAGKIALLEATPDLIKNGIFLETNPKNDEGLVSHIFAAKATIDDIPYAISYVVREDINGRRYYDHSLTKIEALDRIDDQEPHIFTDEESERTPRTNKTGLPLKSIGEESTVKILKKHLDVNTQE